MCPWGFSCPIVFCLSTIQAFSLLISETYVSSSFYIFTTSILQCWIIESVSENSCLHDHCTLFASSMSNKFCFIHFITAVRSGLKAAFKVKVWCQTNQVWFHFSVQAAPSWNQATTFPTQEMTVSLLSHLVHPKCKDYQPTCEVHHLHSTVQDRKWPSVLLPLIWVSSTLSTIWIWCKLVQSCHSHPIREVSDLSGLELYQWQNLHWSWKFSFLAMSHGGSGDIPSSNGNQLSRWFSPELLAQAQARAGPPVPAQSMLSVEDIERLQQAVHN